MHPASAFCIIVTQLLPLQWLLSASLFSLTLHAVLIKPAITISALLKLIIHNDRIVFIHGFFYIGNIPLIFFPSFFTENCLRVWRVLEHPETETAIFLWAQTTRKFLYHNLFWQAAYKKIVFCYIVKVAAITVTKHFIVIIGITVMFQSSNKIVLSILVEEDN